MSDPGIDASPARGPGYVMVAVGLAAGGAALGIGGWDAHEWGPRTVPLLAAATLVASGVAIAGASARHGTTAPPPVAVEGEVPDGTSPDVPTHDTAVLWLLGIAVLYVLAIDRIGYLLATGLAAPVAFWLFGARRPLTLVFAATLVPLALHVAFFRLLGVFPPLGTWFDLLDHVPL